MPNPFKLGKLLSKGKRAFGKTKLGRGFRKARVAIKKPGLTKLGKAARTGGVLGALAWIESSLGFGGGEEDYNLNNDWDRVGTLEGDKDENQQLSLADQPVSAQDNLDVELAKTDAEKESLKDLDKEVDKDLKKSKDKSDTLSKLASKYGVTFKKSVPQNKTKSEVTETKPESAGIFNLFTPSNNISEDHVLEIENLLKLQAELLADQNKLLYGIHKTEGDKIESDLTAAEQSERSLRKLETELDSANAEAQADKVTGSVSNMSVNATPPSISSSESMPEETESEESESEEDEDEGFWDKLKGWAAGLGSFIGLDMLGGDSNQSEKSSPSAGESKAEGGFTRPGGKYEPAGTVHAGEWVANQETVNSPRTAPIIEQLDRVQRSGAQDKVTTTGYAQGGFTPVDLGTSTEPTNEVKVNTNLTSIRNIAKTQIKQLIGDTASNIIDKFIGDIVKYSKNSGSNIGQGLINSIVNSVYLGFINGDWLSKVVSNVTDIAKQYPELSSSAATCINKLTSLDKKTSQGLPKQVLDQLLIAQNNGWITASPADPYRQALGKYGTNLTDQNVAKLVNELKTLNELNKRKSKIGSGTESSGTEGEQSQPGTAPDQTQPEGTIAGNETYGVAPNAYPASPGSYNMGASSSPTIVSTPYNGPVDKNLRDKILGRAAQGTYNYKGQIKKLGHGDYDGLCTYGPGTFYGAAGIPLNGNWWNTGSPYTATGTNIDKAGMVPVWNGTREQAERGDWKSVVQPTDVMVSFGTKSSGAKSSHAQMWTGSDWVSDTYQDGNTFVYPKGRLGDKSAILYRSTQVYPKTSKTSAASTPKLTASVNASPNSSGKSTKKTEGGAPSEVPTGSRKSVKPVIVNNPITRTVTNVTNNYISQNKSLQAETS